MAKNTILEIIIGLKDQASSGLKKLGDGIKDIKSKLGDLKDAGKQALDVFFAPLKAVAVPAIGAVTAALGLATKALREFSGQQLGEQDVVSALIAMGQYSDQYKQKIIDLASTYQTTTGIADDFWLKSLGHLTRFGMNSTNVDKVSDALKNLTGLMDGNIDTATDALAKALQGEFAMFSRFGIVVEKSGDDIKDLDKIITAINTKGSGLLEARANTLSGKWTGLKNQANEVFEAIGTKIANSLNVGGAVDEIKAKLATLTAAIQSGGLGDILETAGQKLHDKIEAAYNWAVKIADAIKESGKPIDVVFADALRAAAGIFMETLGTLISASMEIWKAIGIVIFTTFKEQFMQVDWPKWTGFNEVREKAAESSIDAMSDEQAKSFLPPAVRFAMVPEGQNPVDPRTALRNVSASGGLSTKEQAAIANTGSSEQISNALSDGITGLKTALAELPGKIKTVIETTAGVSPSGSGGGSTVPNGADPVKYQQEYAEKMMANGSRKDSGPATPEKSMITITGPDGAEITKALDEYIAELSKQAEATETAAEKGTETSTKATETVEGIKKTTEEAIKSLDSARESNTKVQDALTTSKTLSQQTILVAQRTQDDLNALVGLVAQISAKQSITATELATLESQVRSMRA